MVGHSFEEAASEALTFLLRSIGSDASLKDQITSIDCYKQFFFERVNYACYKWRESAKALYEEECSE